MTNIIYKFEDMIIQGQKTMNNSVSSIVAPAKINLFLAIKSRYENGYHEIETIFVPLTRLVDIITILPLGKTGIELSCSVASLPTNHRNLCFQAALAFAEATGQSAAWKIFIDKRIPTAAGLGGGSSDAAATLRLLNRISAIKVSASTLHQMAYRLGADVAFFLNPKPALGEGIGEKLTSLVLSCELPLVILNPVGFPLSSAWAYGLVNDGFDQVSAASLIGAMGQGGIGEIAGQTFNRFDQAVRRKLPLVDMFLDFLIEKGCLAAHVSGSGPTVYGICRNQVEAGSIVKLSRRQFGPAVWGWQDRIDLSEFGNDNSFG